MIAGVIVKPLHPIPDERGRVMEILRSDDEFFAKFGQLYLTTAYPGVVKAWRSHKKRIDHLVAVHGMIKLVLYDQRRDSASYGDCDEYFMGDHNPILVQIPPLVVHGYQCIGITEALVLNCTTELHFHNDPDFLRIDLLSREIPYDWSMKRP